MSFYVLRGALNYGKFGRFILQKEKRSAFSFLTEHRLPSKNQSSKLFQKTNYYNWMYNQPLDEEAQLQMENQIEGEKQNSNQKNQEEGMVREGLNRIEYLSYTANEEIEDRIVVGEIKKIGGQMVSVFDGHSGALAAEYASNKITQLIENFLQNNYNKYSDDFDQMIKDCLKSVYHSLEVDFYEDVYLEQLKLRNKKIKRIGTCAITVIIAKNKIYVANCGDSQAIAISQDIGNIEYVKLNERLSVNNPHERQRLKSQFPEESDLIVEENKGCFYLKGRLQPTRSLGDYYMKKAEHWQGKDLFNGPYVKSQPQISVFPIEKSYKSIVVASDGIWDFIDKWTVSRITLQDHAHERILEQTLKKVAQLHKVSEDYIKYIAPGQRRNYHDDITLAVVSLSEK